MQRRQFKFLMYCESVHCNWGWRTRSSKILFILQIQLETEEWCHPKDIQQNNTAITIHSKNQHNILTLLVTSNTHPHPVTLILENFHYFSYQILYITNVILKWQVFDSTRTQKSSYCKHGTITNVQQNNPEFYKRSFLLGFLSIM